MTTSGREHLPSYAHSLLHATSYLVLGTADAEGNPWTTPVWFAPDGLRRLYWLSWPGSRHSQLVERRPEVALTVFDSRVPPNEGAAFYATGVARRCTAEEIDDGLRAINSRAAAQGLRSFDRERVSEPARLRLYVVDVSEAWVLDQDAEVDQRVAVPL